MGVVKRLVLRGLWRRLVGVGIIGPGIYGARAFIMLVLLAALYWAIIHQRGLRLRPLYVVRDLGWCNHDL